MSWSQYLILFVLLAGIAYGNGDSDKNCNRKVESASQYCEKTDLNHNLLVDILYQLTAIKKEIDSLKVQQSQGQTAILNQIIVKEEELKLVINQSLDNVKKEIMTAAPRRQIELIDHQSTEKPEDEFVVPKSTGQMLLLVGGVRIINGTLERTNETIALYLNNGTWIQKSPLPIQITGMTLSQLPSGDVIAVGGAIDYLTSLNKTFVYDIGADRWENGPSMNVARSDACSVSFGSKTYAIGGRSNSQTLNSMEVCDTSKGDSKCENLSPMMTPRTNAKAVIYNDDLYVTGGRGNGILMQALSSCEKYNFQLDEWEAVPDMIYPRYGHELVTINNKIFAIGGIDEDLLNYKTLKSVESFNGHEWVEEPSLNEARVFAAVGVIGQNIYVVGGSTTGIYYDPVMSVEIFDLSTSQWRFVNITGTSPFPLLDSGAVVVDLN